jgi:peptidoglycan hydrolase-like protein with peptidoglycan-binding domain
MRGNMNFLSSLTIFFVGITCAMAQSRYGDQILEKGSSAKQGQYIQLLQLDLYYLHYGVYMEPYGGASGDYNEATVHAVTAFQKDHGLFESGVVGSETAAELEKALAQSELGQAWKDFNPMRYLGIKLKKGHRDDARKLVSQLQKDLTRLGFEVIDASGVFAESTEFALQSFQQEALVPSTKILDEVTVTALTARLCIPEKQINKKKK